MPDSPEPRSSSLDSVGESTGGTALRIASTPGSEPAAGSPVQLATGMLLAADPVVCVSWNDAKAFIDWVPQ